MTKLLLVIVLLVAVVAAHGPPAKSQNKGQKSSRWIDGFRAHSRSAVKQTRAFTSSRSGNLSPRASTSEYGQAYWKAQAKKTVSAQDKIKKIKKKAKNIILFVGDGMGTQTITAARMLLGDESESLSFERFPHVAASKTYCVDEQTADSACSGTAYLCGVKTNSGLIGMNARALYENCETALDKDAPVDSIAKWAQDAGKSTGLVTTTRVTHASPANVYAHSGSRDWEVDSWLPAECDKTRIDDIAKQLVLGETGKNLNVILGGGRSHFFNSSVTDELGTSGKRLDGLDLISAWQNDGKANKKVVKTRKQLMDVKASNTDYLFGLFNPSHLKYFAEGDKTEPTLWDMTKKALEILKKNKNGFFLFVEGGKIDSAHHENQAKLALTETIQFSEAIEKTREMFSEDDTLIVATADHSHVMTVSGYSDRGRPITATANHQWSATDDGLPYYTMSYADGPSFNDHIAPGVGRVNPETQTQTRNDFSTYPAMVPVFMESHGAEDVPIYASGPWAHLFSGILEQNTIPHFMAYASCIGKGLRMCD